MRDEFSAKIKDNLAKRVGYRCSNPDCRRSTSYAKGHEGEYSSLGVAALITAASIGGPRFNSTLSSVQRSSFQNGIWLCQNCSRIIDSDPLRYSVDILNDWKAKAEADNLSESLSGNRPEFTSLSEAHLKYLAERINSFDLDKRHYLGYCYFFGVPPELLEDMSQEEQKSFFLTLIKPYAEFFLAINKPVARLSIKKYNEFVGLVNFKYQTTKSVLFDAVVEFLRLNTHKLMPVSMLIAEDIYAERAMSGDFRDVLRHVTVRSFVKFRAELLIDPKIENAVYRKRTAKEAFAEFPDATEQVFVDSIQRDLETRINEIEELFESINKLIPKDLLLVFESKLFTGPAASLKNVISLLEKNSEVKSFDEAHTTFHFHLTPLRSAGEVDC